MICTSVKARESWSAGDLPQKVRCRDGKELDERQWHSLHPVQGEFDHPVREMLGERGLRFGHSGADWQPTGYPACGLVAPCARCSRSDARCR